MSKYVQLTLHNPEETLAYDAATALQKAQPRIIQSPISYYFETADRLKLKIIGPYRNDGEVLGLLVLGIVSAAEFYFRSIISELINICPLCRLHAEMIVVPSGAYGYYESSAFSYTMSAFEHESLADSRKLASEFKRFSGFLLLEDGSVKKALEDFEMLCELRHCFIHAQGYAGLKASHVLKSDSRTLQSVTIDQLQALDLIKIAHNTVRAVNKFIANSVVNRWIDKGVLIGTWRKDKTLFAKFIAVFSKNEIEIASIAIKDLYEEEILEPIKKRKLGLARKAIA